MGTATGTGSDGAYMWYCGHRASVIGLAPLDRPLSITRARGTFPKQPERSWPSTTAVQRLLPVDPRRPVATTCRLL